MKVIIEEKDQMSAKEGMAYVQLGLTAEQIALIPESFIERLSNDERTPTVEIKALAEALNLPYSTRTSGTFSGHGHGRTHETIGQYEIWKITYCQGPGYSCSYDHGPWVKTL